MSCSEYIIFSILLPICFTVMLLLGFSRRKFEDKHVKRPYKMTDTAKLPKCFRLVFKKKSVPAVRVLYVSVIALDIVLYLLITAVSLLCVFAFLKRTEIRPIDFVPWGVEFAVFLASCGVIVHALDEIERFDTLLQKKGYVLYSEPVLKQHARRLAKGCAYELTIEKKRAMLMVKSENGDPAVFEIAGIKRSRWVNFPIMKLYCKNREGRRNEA